MILTGGFLVTTGFLYDLVFAGLPYQDPSVDQQVAWNFHKSIAENVILTGLVTFLTGTIWGIVRLAIRRK